MTTTIAPSEVPASLLNAQGTQTILDPVAIKKSSAAKMRLADKTGNVALRKEAAAEQSFADRLGGRTALLSDELKKQIQEQKEAAAKVVEGVEANPESSVLVVSEETPKVDSPTETKRTRKNKNKQPVESTESADSAQRKPLDSSSQPFEPKQTQVQNAVIAAINANYSLPPEAIILKLDAATKQSIADKTGNLVLKRTAALEQSLADKMAYVSAPGVATTALRAGRKGFMLETSLLQQPTAAPVAAPKQKTPQQSPTQQRQQRQQQQKKERSYFNKDNQSTPSRADTLDWRTPSPKQSPTQPHTAKYQAPRGSPKQKMVQDGASFEPISPKTAEPKLDIVEKEPEVMVGPIINPLAPAAACM